MKSKRGTQFRIRAIEILKEYMRKGFVLDDERLKNLGGGGYFKELLERIRDIRASEKVFYRQVLEIYATSIDYDPKAEIYVMVFQWADGECLFDHWNFETYKKDVSLKSPKERFRELSAAKKMAAVKAVCADRNGRYKTFGEFYEEWSRSFL